MKNSLGDSTRPNIALFYFAALGLTAVGLTLYYQHGFTRAILASGAKVAPQVAQASLTSGTEGWLRQTAEHMSKMQGGASIGGFPGFEPPDNDEKYRRKVKDGTYNSQDVNDWVKDINNFLKQIVEKNPNMSLEEILQKQGLPQTEIEGFVRALRNVHATAKGMSGYGVNPETVERLESLMEILGVSAW